MADPTRHLQRGSSEKLLADYFIDTGLSGAASLFGDFLEGVLGMWRGDVEKARRPAIAKAVELYGQAVAQGEPFADILGSTYMAIASRGGRAMLGQYFTPPNVAEMLARLNDLSGSSLREDRLTRIYDPACGSGALLLGAARVLLQESGPASLNRVHFCGTDLDLICARVAAVQLVANSNVLGFDLGAIDITHGDTLRGTTFGTIVSASSLRPWKPAALVASEVEAKAMDPVTEALASTLRRTSKRRPSLERQS